MGVTRAKVLLGAAVVVLVGAVVAWFLRPAPVRPASVQDIQVAQDNLVRVKEQVTGARGTVARMVVRQGKAEKLARRVLNEPEAQAEAGATIPSPTLEDAQELAQETLEQGQDLVVVKDQLDLAAARLEDQQQLNQAVAVQLEDADKHRLTWRKGSFIVGATVVVVVGLHHFLK